MIFLLQAIEHMIHLVCGQYISWTLLPPRPSGQGVINTHNAVPACVLNDAYTFLKGTHILTQTHTFIGTDTHILTQTHTFIGTDTHICHVSVVM